MILTGKLLVEAANTAEAKVWSFLSKNSAKGIEKDTLICINFFQKVVQNNLWSHLEHSQELSPTLQCVLLHLNFIELVGSNDDAVSGQMDAAARLRGFNLLEKSTAWTDISPLYSLQITLSLESCVLLHLSSQKGEVATLKTLAVFQKHVKKKLLLEESFVLLEVMLECRLAYQLSSGEILFLLEEYTALEDILLLCSSDF